LAEARIPLTLPDGAADPGLIQADSSAADAAAADFFDAMALHRHFGRKNDPPAI
jgi:catalase